MLIEPINAAGDVTSYRVTDTPAGFSGMVTIFTWVGDRSVSAHCLACRSSTCVHADQVLTFHLHRVRIA